MKKNIFLSMVVAIALCIGSSTIATTFTNYGAYEPVQVRGRGGLWYTVGSRDISGKNIIRPGKKGESNMREFETGMQDDLAIRVGKEPRILHFNLTEIKRYFSVVNDVNLFYSGNQYLLQIVGEPKNSRSATEIDNYCMTTGNCSLDPISKRGGSLIVNDVLQLQDRPIIFYNRIANYDISIQGDGRRQNISSNARGFETGLQDNLHILLWDIGANKSIDKPFKSLTFNLATIKKDFDKIESAELNYDNLHGLNLRLIGKLKANVSPGGVRTDCRLACEVCGSRCDVEFDAKRNSTIVTGIKASPKKGL